MKSELFASALLIAAPASAQEFCFNLTKYTDIFRISSVQVGDNVLDFGTDVASPGYQGYALPLVGVSVPIITSGYFHKAVLMSDNDTGAFGKHNYCTVEYSTAPFFQLSISCDGGHKGEWTKLGISAQSFPCSGSPSGPPPGAKPIGLTPSDK